MSFLLKSPILTIVIILLERLSRTNTHSWTLGKPISRRNVRVSLPSLKLATTTPTSSLTTSSNSPNDSPMDELKQILQREYVTFFNPMRKEFYAPNVTFQDPLTSLVGIDAYQQNVDMLAGRTLLGSLLFEDATISLHSITGGEIMDDDDNNNNNLKDTTNVLYQDIVTRWTLRFTMKVLPWKPTARFSGISVYKIQSRNKGPDIQIVAQQDYWDSINILKPQTPTQQPPYKPQDWYQTVDQRIGLQDFLQQIRPTLSLQASQAAPELPYELLRRGSSYDVRRYPSSYVIQVTYTGRRRDEALTILGSLTRTTSTTTITNEGPLGPAIIQVTMDDTTTTTIKSKTMQWPLTFALPGSDMAPMPIRTLQEVEEYIRRSSNTDSWDCRILSIPSRVVAVMEFSDASLEPVIRKVDYQLRQVLQKDGLLQLHSSKQEEEDTVLSSVMTFAQYDAVYSMGKRRGEVWMELKDEHHPW